MDFERVKHHAGYISGKLLFILAVAACLVLGLIGLVIPIIPGLLFLGIAAFLLAPYVPGLNRRMQRSALMRRYMKKAERLRHLKTGAQIRLGAWLSLQMMLDAARFVGAKLSPSRVYGCDPRAHSSRYTR